MIRINNISLPLDFDFKNLSFICAEELKINPNDIKYSELVKKSVDARKKDNVHFVVSVDIEALNEDL